MSNALIIPEEVIVSKIYYIREQKVMLSHELSELYQVETKALNQQVKRNRGRFPKKYMFRLTQKEYSTFLRSQNVTLKRGQYSKYLPYAFTQLGVLMLSSVLRSERAEKVNMLIMEAFIKINEMLLTHKDILLKLEVVEKKVASQDEKVLMIFNYLKQFIQDQKTPRKQIGFKTKNEE